LKRIHTKNQEGLERFVLKIPKDDKSALHKKSSILGMKKPLKEVILVILKDKISFTNLYFLSSSG
jgi:hypothetical protein